MTNRQMEIIDILRSSDGPVKFTKRDDRSVAWNLYKKGLLKIVGISEYALV